MSLQDIVNSITRPLRIWSNYNIDLNTTLKVEVLPSVLVDNPSFGEDWKPLSRVFNLIKGAKEYEDFRQNPVYKVVYYWAMGNPRFRFTSDWIAEKIPELNGSEVKGILHELQFTPWEDVTPEPYYPVSSYGQRVLMVGAGTGEESLTIAHNSEVIAVEKNPYSADTIRNRIIIMDSKPNISIIEGDFMDLDNYSNYFTDLVLHFVEPWSNLFPDSNMDVYFKSKYYARFVESGGQIELVTEDPELFYRFARSDYDHLILIEEGKIPLTSISTSYLRSAVTDQTEHDKSKLYQINIYKLVWKLG